MRYGVVLLAAIGCGAATSGEGGSVGNTTTTGAVTDASCRGTDNALRYTCSVTLDAAAEVTWTLRDGDATVRTWTTPSGTVHEGDLWGLAPEHAYTWQASSSAGTASGELTTGALPDALSGVSVTTSGTAPDVDALLVPLACGDFTGLAMIDPAGRLVWYQDAGSAGGSGGTAGITGFDRTEDGDLVAGVDGERVVEWTPMGDVAREITGFEHPLHHDLAAADGRIWALYAEEVDGFVVDGFDVIGADDAIEASWDLADHVTVSGTTSAHDPFWQQVFPGDADWSHANSIEERDGLLLVSFRWLDAVMELPADPDQPDFGEPVFTLVGDPSSPLASDLAFTDGGGFLGQHDAGFAADGHVSLFDNETGTDARGLHLALDLDAGTVTEAESWSLGKSCDVQGSVYDLPDGDVLVTCGTEGWIGAFPHDGGGASWTMDVTCSGGDSPGQPLARAMPVDW